MITFGSGHPKVLLSVGDCCDGTYLIKYMARRTFGCLSYIFCDLYEVAGATYKVPLVERSPVAIFFCNKCNCHL